jgi:hypothetical protein
MSDYQTGRVGGVFTAGQKIENLGEAYEKEAASLDAMKTAFGMAAKLLEDYLTQMFKELNDAKITIKEAEYGKTYVNRCIELMRKMYNDTEAKRLQACGAAEAMKQAVSNIKRAYDEEHAKMLSHQEYENLENKDVKARPVGADPGNPIEEYKQLELFETTQDRPEKKVRSKKRGKDT